MRVVAEQSGLAVLATAPESADTFRVLKFGSSVLRATIDAASAAAEVARMRRAGDKVLAVVSAYLGETDRLLDDARTLGRGGFSRHAARLVSLGEERACLGLAIACEAAGLHADYLDIETMGLAAKGPDDEATPSAVDRQAIEATLRAHDVVIVPGFAALKDGRHVLLGRGGSDLSAVFLAEALGQNVVTLIKDVDGVYDRDPAAAGGKARRYDRLSYQEAARVAGKLVQSRAIAFAEARNVTVRVRRIGEDRATDIGAF